MFFWWNINLNLPDLTESSFTTLDIKIMTTVSRSLVLKWHNELKKFVRIWQNTPTYNWRVSLVWMIKAKYFRNYTFFKLITPCTSPLLLGWTALTVLGWNTHSLLSSLNSEESNWSPDIQNLAKIYFNAPKIVF